MFFHLINAFFQQNSPLLQKQKTQRWSGYNIVETHYLLIVIAQLIKTHWMWRLETSIVWLFELNKEPLVQFLNNSESENY